MKYVNQFLSFLNRGKSAPIKIMVAVIVAFVVVWHSVALILGYR